MGILAKRWLTAAEIAAPVLTVVARPGGWLDGALKVRVAAVPEAGRANAALEALLALALGIRKSAVRVAAGRILAERFRAGETVAALSSSRTMSPMVAVMAAYG